MAEASCRACGQPRKACQCPPPDRLDTIGLMSLEQEARVRQRRQAVEDACCLLRACATLPHELPPLVQTAVEDALSTLRHLFLPPPQPPRVTRGRRPDFDSDDAFRAALDAGLKRFSRCKRREPLTKAGLAPYVHVKTPDGQVSGLSERALNDNLKLFGVDWKAFKGTYKNGKNSRR